MMAEDTPELPEYNWAERYEQPEYQRGGVRKRLETPDPDSERTKELIKEGLLVPDPKGSHWPIPIWVTRFQYDPQDPTSAVVSEHRLPSFARVWGYSPEHLKPIRDQGIHGGAHYSPRAFDWEDDFFQEIQWLEFEKQRMLRGGFVPVAYRVYPDTHDESDVPSGFAVMDLARWLDEHPGGSREEWEQQYKQPVNLWARESRNRGLDGTNAYENSDDFKSGVEADRIAGLAAYGLRNNTFSRVLDPQAPARFWHAPEPCCLYLAGGVFDAKWNDYIVTAIGRVFFLVGGAESDKSHPERFGAWNGPVFNTPAAWRHEDAFGPLERKQVNYGSLCNPILVDKREAILPEDDIQLYMEIWKARVVHVDVDSDAPRRITSPLWLEGTWLPHDHIEVFDPGLSDPITMQGLGYRHTEKQVRDLHRGQDLLQEIFWYEPPRGGPPVGSGMSLSEDMVKAAWDAIKTENRPYPTQADIASPPPH